MKGKVQPMRGWLVKTIFVDNGSVLKRMRPAPQGRGYRVRKRSNHVTLIVDEKKYQKTKIEIENGCNDSIDFEKFQIFKSIDTWVRKQILLVRGWESFAVGNPTGLAIRKIMLSN